MSRAIVISGGGSKGAFAVGVVKKLLKDFPNLNFDVLVGTSTGSLIIPLIAIREFELLEELYTSQTTEKIVRKGNLGDRLGQNAIFDANPLWDLICRYFDDDNYHRLMDCGKKIYMTTVCLQTGELVVYTNEPGPAPSKHYQIYELKSADHFRKAMMASSCQPVFMPPIKVNKNITGMTNRDFQYVDGGIREYAGVQVAIDKGSTEVFTVLLSPPTDQVVQEEYETVFPILTRTIDIFTADVGKNDLIIPDMYNRALQYIQSVKKKMLASGMPAATVNEFFATPDQNNPFENKIPLKLFTVRPADPLGGGPGGLTFDPEEMKGMVATGELIAGSFIASLGPDDITWA